MPKAKPGQSKADKLAAAQAEHERYLRKLGLPTKVSRKRPKYDVPFPDYTKGRVDLPVSNEIPGGIAARHSVLEEHLWKRDRQEKPETVEAMRDKARRIGPAYNKGAAQYLTDGHDPTKDGRRRT